MDSFLMKWNVFIDALITKGGYKDVITGLINTFKISVLGLVIGIFVGTLLATVKVMPRYKLIVRVLQKIVDGYVALFRGTPIVVQLLVSYYVFFKSLGSVTTCIVIFGLNSGAYISEIMRGGIKSVDPGQMEAGRALGLSYSMTMIKIVIPQAVKNILPTLGNEFIALIKETSVVSFVSAVDLNVAFRKMAANTYEFIIPYLALALVYIIIVAVFTVLIRLMERRLARSDRNRQSDKKVRKSHGA